MGATNTNREGGKSFYKLKEDEREGKSKGELRFFKQEKKGDKWVDSEAFDTLSGEVVKVDIKEFEFQGEKKKSLVIGVQDGIDLFEFTLGLRSFTAQGILNTLAGNNPKHLYFSCGRTKEVNGKLYPSLYINKDGATNEERRTTWKYAPAELPKVTTTTDEDGNKIKKGQKSADEFWMKIVEDIKSKLGKPVAEPTMPQPTSNSADDLPF